MLSLFQGSLNTLGIYDSRGTFQFYSNVTSLTSFTFNLLYIPYIFKIRNSRTWTDINRLLQESKLISRSFEIVDFSDFQNLNFCKEIKILYQEFISKKHPDNGS